MRSFLVALALLVAAAPSVAQNVESPIVLTSCQTIYSNATVNANFTGYTRSDGTQIATTPVALTKFRPHALSAVAYSSPTSGTTPTLDIKIQSCETTAASTCSDLFTFDQCTTSTCYGGDNMQIIDLNDALANSFKYFRVVVTVGGTTPVYSSTVKLCAD